MTTNTLAKLMKQAQVFASAWSLVGGRFDSGNCLEEAEAAKAELREMIHAALASQATTGAATTGGGVTTGALTDHTINFETASYSVAKNEWTEHVTPEYITDHEIETLAHRMCWRYKKSSDPHHSSTYTFNRVTLQEFARKLMQGETE